MSWSRMPQRPGTMRKTEHPSDVCARCLQGPRGRRELDENFFFACHRDSTLATRVAQFRAIVPISSDDAAVIVSCMRLGARCGDWARVATANPRPCRPTPVSLRPPPVPVAGSPRYTNARGAVRRIAASSATRAIRFGALVRLRRNRSAAS